MEEMPAYARVMAGRLIHQQLNKPFLGRPYLKYGQCFGLWSYLFELGGILAAKHAANLEAFVPAFLRGSGDSGTVKQDFTAIAKSLVAEGRVNNSMKFFDYVQAESIRLAKYKGDGSSFLLKHGKEKVPPKTAAELAQFYAIQGAALGAIYPDLLRAIFQQTYFSHTREQWEKFYAAGSDIGPYQPAKSYKEAEEEENKGFMAYCRESYPQLYSVLSKGESVSDAFETLEVKCPFTPHKRYRVCRASELLTVGEVVTFDLSMIATREDALLMFGEVLQVAETPMYAFTSEADGCPRWWFPQPGETIESWHEYFEEL